MSCNLCTPNGWNKKCCSICGHGPPVYISICITTVNDDEQFPYTQTDLCKKCYAEYGIESAFDHNREMVKETERMIDDEGVFSPDQIRYLQVMLQQISRAIACKSNELDQRSIGE